MKKIVICGFGEMGKRHGLDMEELSGGQIEVAGVYEPDDVKYSQGCEWIKHSPERFSSIREMLDKVNPDGAIISSPNFQHLVNLREFKGRNIPLIIEKPLDSSLEKIFEILRFVRDYPAPVMVHHVMRYSPIVRKAKEILDQGKIGKISSFRFNQTIGGHMFHNFRRTMKTGGGQLLEKATHDFDVLLHWVESAPKRVSAICKQQKFGGNKPDDLHCCDCSEKDTCPESMAKHVKPAFKDVKPSNDLCVFAKCVDVPDNEVCMLELENGVFGTYSNTYFTHGFYSRVYEVYGTEGTMQLCFTLPNRKRTGNDDFDGTLEIYPNHDKYECHEFKYEGRIHYNGAPGVVAHFNNLMDGKDKPYSPVDQAFAAELIAAAAYKSNDEKQQINIMDLLPEDLKPMLSEAFRK